MILVLDSMPGVTATATEHTNRIADTILLNAKKIIQRSTNGMERILCNSVLPSALFNAPRSGSPIMPMRTVAVRIHVVRSKTVAREDLRESTDGAGIISPG